MRHNIQSKVDYYEKYTAFWRVGRLMTISLVAIGISACTVTTEPLTEAELSLTAEDRMQRVTQDQEPVVRSISLYEAMARALKYNLDYRVELFAKELASQKANLARSDLLPDLVANSHYSNRSNDPFTFSRSRTGVPSVDPSVSREQESFTSDLTFSWHILDFGLSYARAKQAADKTLIAEEQRRKVINRIIEDVRTAYWRAVSADRLLSGFNRLESRVESALANSRSLQNNGYTSPVAALTYQRELVDIKRQTQRLQRELKTSKIQLAALMNLKPGEHYNLVLPKRKLSSLSLQVPSNEIMRLALQNRPELRELSYAGRINEREAEIALLELLPGIQLYAGLNYDSNDFLLNNDWVSWGAKASWNVMKIFAYPVKKRVIELESDLIDQRGLAMTMAVMTQVEVARARYHYLRKTAATAQQYYSVQRRLRDQVRASAGANTASEQSLIREEMNTLLASAQYDMAYADLQNAFAAIYASIGVDPFGDELDTSQPVGEVAKALRTTWRERGDVAG